MPDFDQSVAKQVGFDLSNILTPCSISFVINAFEVSNAWSRSGVHSNLDPMDFKRALNGSIVSVVLKA